MAVDGLAVTVGGLQLLHDIGDTCQHSRIVHHLSKVMDVVAGHQLLDVDSVEGEARSFERSGRHAAGSAEIELEMTAFAAVDHIVDAFHTHHVGNLVRVAHRGHRAVRHRHACKFRGRHHRAFDVDVGIDKARHDKPWLGFWRFGDFGNLAVTDGDGSRKDP